MKAGSLFGGIPFSCSEKNVMHFGYTKTPASVHGSYFYHTYKNVSGEIPGGIIVTDIGYDLIDDPLIIRKLAALDRICDHIA